jgi:uncharacterized protein (TIGR02687 family)
MNEGQIAEALSRLYNDRNRLVFWNDPDREFEEAVASLVLDGVEVLRVDQAPALELKRIVERERPQDRFLLYTPSEVPAAAEDWLLDMRLYSRAFRADRASILISELGLQNQSLRSHLQARAKFLGSKDRLYRLRSLVQPLDREQDLDRKILAVLVKADLPDFPNILISLLHTLPPGDLDGIPSAWEEIGKFGLAATFWSLAQEVFGYAEETPSLRNLLIRLLVTDLAHAATQELPPALAHLRLPKGKSANVAVGLAQWRDSHTRRSSYDALSDSVARALKLEDHLAGFSLDNLLDVKTFELIEKFIAVSLRDRVLVTAASINPDAIRAVAVRRQDGYWADAQRSTGGDTRKALHEVYNALVAAADLFGLQATYSAGFPYTSAKEMFTGYTDELWRFDRLYRDFIQASDAAEAEGWDVLKRLREQVEDCYVNGFLAKVSLKWGSLIENDLLNSWRIEGVRSQQRFYHSKVEAALEEETDRVFVIISDAFRYEAARELVDDLNGRFRLKATVEPFLGVLPSYTALGMAALLPHKKLSFTEKGDVFVDGQSSTASNRSAILASVKGIAIRADDLRELKKDEGRAFVKPHQVVYIYHNVIDATGDNAATEAHTFDAVRRAVQELSDLTRLIINGLNGSVVHITADHGFLFQDSALGTSDKNALNEKPAGTILAKKRYLLGRNLPDNVKAYHGVTSVTAGAVGDMEFWVPKGNNRFHFVGGSRFVHGGAMLQEVVVPVVTVREVEGGARHKTKTKHVTVMAVGQNHKITTNRWRVELLQTEKVTDRVKPVTLDVAVYYGDQPITNVERVTFDSTSENFEERKKPVVLSLKGRSYDRSIPYHLILRNAETGIEEGRTEVSIHIAFMDEF